MADKTFDMYPGLTCTDADLGKTATITLVGKIKRSTQLELKIGGQHNDGYEWTHAVYPGAVSNVEVSNDESPVGSVVRTSTPTMELHYYFHCRDGWMCTCTNSNALLLTWEELNNPRSRRTITVMYDSSSRAVRNG